MGEIPHMDIGEFVEEGYLQEVNRRLLHPLGLALEVTREEDGSAFISGVWDYRDDPEGIWFEGEAEPEKTRRINELFAQRSAARHEALGFVVEPVRGTLTLSAGDPITRDDRFLGWLREHDIDPNVVTRVEVAGEAMTVYRFKQLPGGRFFIEDGQVAQEEPITIACKRPCPVALAVGP